VKLRSVYPGLEIRDIEGVGFLILADREFTASEFANKSGSEIVAMAHAQGFLVISPHWWKEKRCEWEYLARLGIDGFEIFSSAYKNFDKKMQAKLIAFCKQRRLLMVGTTDWHGWGSFTDVWTLVGKKGLDQQKPGELLDHLRQAPEVRVVVRRPPSERFGPKSLLEPFAGAVWYFGSLSSWQATTWAGWIILLGALHAALGGRRLQSIIVFVLSQCTLAVAVLTFIRWFMVHSDNVILVRKLGPIFSGLAVGWYFVWRSVRRRPLRPETVGPLRRILEQRGVTRTVVRDRVWLHGELIEETYDRYAQDKDANVWFFGEEAKQHDG
jgi:hypothetical protein